MLRLAAPSFYHRSGPRRNLCRRVGVRLVGGPAAALAVMMLVVAGPGPAAAQATGQAALPPSTAAIGRINNSVGGHCTGILVAPSLAVTAAHCLYNKRTQRWLRPEAIHLLVGYDRGTYAFHATAQAYRLGERYDAARPFETIADDWALLTLADPAPASIAPMAMAAAEPASPPLRLLTAGFARARPYVLSVSKPCNVAPAAGGLLAADCPAPNGFSGGPLIDPASGRLAGIVVARSATGSIGIPAAAFQAALAELSAAPAPLDRP